MGEIGGYIELDNFTGKMLHEGAVALNSGRKALAYLIEAKEIKEIWLAYYNCDVIAETCKQYGVKVNYYHIDSQFKPVGLPDESDICLYLVNYYGQLEYEYIIELREKFRHVIVDNVQAYFAEPVPGVDTLYTCRKFFGVSDGAFLYTDKMLERELPVDESFERIHYVLGRYERNASEFYAESKENNFFFSGEPIRQMSKLTKNILHGIDYDRIKRIRSENFLYLHEHLRCINQLNVHPVEGAFMYPLMLANAAELKNRLVQHKIYISVIWPNVVDELPHDWWEWRLANNIMPLIVDQRYGNDDMERICKTLEMYI